MFLEMDIFRSSQCLLVHVHHHHYHHRKCNNKQTGQFSSTLSRHRSHGSQTESASHVHAQTIISPTRDPRWPSPFHSPQFRHFDFAVFASQPIYQLIISFDIGYCNPVQLNLIQRLVHKKHTTLYALAISSEFFGIDNCRTPNILYQISLVTNLREID